VAPAPASNSGGCGRFPARAAAGFHGGGGRIRSAAVAASGGDSGRLWEAASSGSGGRASGAGSGLLLAAAAGYLCSSSWEERKIIFVFFRELIELTSGAHVHLSK
jgi:hypothetical protein